MGAFGLYPKVVVRKKISDDKWNAYVIGATEVEETEIRKKIYINYEHRTEWDFEPVEHEAVCCLYFGCGKQLSMGEMLLGNYCPKHQHQEPKPIHLIDKYLFE